MLHQTFLFLGQLWQLFEVSQILEFLRLTTVPFKATTTPHIWAVTPKLTWSHLSHQYP